jgi:hypothetical protein
MIKPVPLIKGVVFTLCSIWLKKGEQYEKEYFHNLNGLKPLNSPEIDFAVVTGERTLSQAFYMANICCLKSHTSTVLFGSFSCAHKMSFICEAIVTILRHQMSWGMTCLVHHIISKDRYRMALPNDRMHHWQFGHKSPVCLALDNSYLYYDQCCQQCICGIPSYP